LKTDLTRITNFSIEGRFVKSPSTGQLAFYQKFV